MVRTDKFTGEPRYEWFVEQLDAGNLQYINKEKTARLFENEKPEWLMPFLNSDGFLNNSIPNEDDLRNEREANEGIINLPITNRKRNRIKALLE